MKKVIHLEILEQLGKLVTSGLGLVAALAWNNAILELFKRVFGSERSSLAALFWYALIVTVIVVLLSIRIGQTIEKIKENQKQEPIDGGEAPVLPKKP